MSTVVHPKGHRHSRSAVLPPNAASPHHPQNPYHLGLQSQAQQQQPAMDYSAQPSTPPRTPRRDNGHAASQNKANSGAPDASSKQKSRNKKQKNVTTSPAPNARNGHNTPATAGHSSGAQSSAKPISTPAAAAYAGPTFHASPAPSALPIPSFYSKSVPESPGIKGMKPVKEPSSPDSSTPPSVPVSHLQLQREESPLDIFFKADREEKARARSASSSQTAAGSGPFPPPPGSARASQTPPASTNQSRLRHASKLSGSGIFAMELDASPSPGSPYGPAFSTPYSERINAARSSQTPQTSSDPSIKTGQQTPSSEALKAYLFAPAQQASPASSSANPFEGGNVAASAPPTAPTETRNAYPFGGPRGPPPSSFPQANHYPTAKPGRPSSGLRQEVTPTRTPNKTPDRNSNKYPSTTPSRTYQQQVNANNFASIYGQGNSSPLPPSPYSAASGNNSGDLKGMEDNLRKMLKLDSGPPGATGQNIDMVSAAAVSVPSYIGSRAPLQ